MQAFIVTAQRTRPILRSESHGLEGRWQPLKLTVCVLVHPVHHRLCHPLTLKPRKDSRLDPGSLAVPRKHATRSHDAAQSLLKAALSGNGTGRA